MNRSNGYILGEITKINGKNIDFTLKSSEEIKNGPIMTLKKFGVIGIYNRENDINNLFILELINNFNNESENFTHNLIQEYKFR